MCQLTRLVLAALALGSLVACSNQNAEGEPSLVPSTVLVVENDWPVGGEWRYSAPWATPTQLFASQYRVWQEAISVCMADKGFSYLPVTYVDSGTVFGLINPLNVDVLQYGYHDPPVEEPVVPEPKDTSQEYYDALISPGACADTARQYVYGTPISSGVANYLDEMTNSVDRAIAGYESSPDGQQRLENWRECMSGKGYEYSSPAAPRSKWNGGPDISSEEIEVRRADYDCDLTAKLTESRSKFEAATFALWSDTNAESVRELTDLERESAAEVAELASKLDELGAEALEPVGNGEGLTTESTIPRGSPRPSAPLR